MTAGIKANADGSAAIQVGGSDAITITSGLVVSMNGGVGGLVSGTAVASTSGTSIDFTSIPSWVKRVTVMFNGVSTSGSSLVQVQIGSGSFTTSGYTCYSGYAGGTNQTSAFAYTSGFVLDDGLSGGAAFIRYGILTIDNLTGNTWIPSFQGNVNTSTCLCGCFTCCFGFLFTFFA